ncbi:threonine synthase [Aliikangiella marina]|uniref:Threonine synthase n=1 Tax=Aliikangiella marina TaxID=1712262 RepID=A0A545T2U4_9GAMM|nr:threonine synthase [Aliikangiella marina]TQV71536.1 threonine synthase [Aliikangiella marina]
MSFFSHFYCTACGTTYPKNKLMNLCSKDNRPLQIAIDIDKLKQEKTNFSWYRPGEKSMWRFGSLMALDINDENDKQSILSLGEGNTPIIPLIHSTIAKKHNFSLFLKDEGQPHPGFGANPTGSFKDRGMSMAVSMARSFGIKKVVVPTQGNAGDSLTEYAMAAGMECTVIMPDETPMPILGRVSALAKIHPSINLELVKGTIREAGELMKEKYLPQGFFNMATFQEPGWRIEGKKTLGLEIAEPADGINQPWKLPDVVLYPTGGGTGILGMWKAFDELEALGLIDSRRPKVISVQSTVTPPVVNAFNNNEADTTPVSGGYTIATGLNVPGGVGHFKVLEIIRQSGGMAISVDEDSMGEQLKSIYDQYQIWICPEGAATIAAIPEAVEKEMIKPGDKVVAFNTGSFEKYLPNIRDLIFA